MRFTPLTRRRVTAGLVAATLLLAACGGSESSDAGEALPAADAAGSDQSGSGESDAGEPDAASTPPGSARLDLVGADVIPAADVDSNPLPSVVVNDLNTAQEVNFRNLVPQDKPILLWMWAPH